MKPGACSGAISWDERSVCDRGERRHPFLITSSFHFFIRTAITNPPPPGIPQDAYVLSRILRASITTRASLPLALEAFQAVRRPYGNKHIVDARLVLQEFQYNAPHGGDMGRVRDAIRRIFEEAAGIGRGQTGPDEDANRGVFWMEVNQRASRMP